MELYQKLHTGEHPELLENFESILLGVIKDIRQYQVENERLEKTFKRSLLLFYSLCLCVCVFVVREGTEHASSPMCGLARACVRCLLAFHKQQI